MYYVFKDFSRLILLRQVLQTDVLIQNNVTLWRNTVNEGIAKYEMHNSKEPLMLHDHGEPVSYRNIWIREL